MLQPGRRRLIINLQARRYLERPCLLARYVTTQCRERVQWSVSFFLLLRSAKNATAKFIEVICFVNFVVFHILSKIISIINSRKNSNFWIRILNDSIFIRVPVGLQVLGQHRTSPVFLKGKFLSHQQTSLVKKSYNLRKCQTYQ